MSDIFQKEVGILGYLILVIVLALPVVGLLLIKENKQRKIEEDLYYLASEVTVSKLKKLCASGRCMYELILQDGRMVTTSMYRELEPPDTIWITARCSVLDRGGPCSARVLPLE